MTISTCKVAVIGAGPFGLAAVAHLRAAGLETRVFGEAMGAWRRHMPAGMFIRTRWVASHIHDPHGALTLDRCVAAGIIKQSSPQPLADLITYGLWFQHHVAPDLDQRSVTRVESSFPGFRVILEDGECVRAQHVVIAAGLTALAYSPDPFRSLPSSLASHTAHHSDPEEFTGQRVLILGGGLSAFEFAVQLGEAGADVEVVMRAPTLPWLEEARGTRQTSYAKQLYRNFMANHDGLVQRTVHPHVGVGPPPFSWLSAKPGLVSRLPYARREWMNQWSLRRLINRGAEWFPSRLVNVTLTAGRQVISTNVAGDSLHITLDDGSARAIDHLLLATGYRLDIAHYPFLAPELIRSARRIDGYPKLNAGLESAVPGLHFAGPITQGKYGPIMYSLGGTGYAARVLTQSIVGAARNEPMRAVLHDSLQIECGSMFDVERSLSDSSPAIGERPT
jgi:cation diffusion facilitator CzcD-associated flavoprotein CzcO